MSILPISARILAEFGIDDKKIREVQNGLPRILYSFLAGLAVLGIVLVLLSNAGFHLPFLLTPYSYGSQLGTTTTTPAWLATT